MTLHATPSPVASSQDEFVRTKERARKLAWEKSYLQLIIHMMSQLGRASGLDETVGGILTSFTENIGGTDAELYYIVDNEVFYADLRGNRRRADKIDDDMVRDAFENGEFREYEHDFRHTRMMTEEFTRAWTWVFPLVVGSEIIGVFKVSNMHVAMREMANYLPVFFNFVALGLKNEIHGHSRLRHAYDELTAINAELLREIAVREEAQETIRRQQTFTKAVLDTIEDGVVACDESGTLTLFNRATRTFHGIDESRLPPEQWSERYNLYRADGVTPMPPEDIPLFRAFQGETVHDAEMVIASRDGPKRWLLASGQPMFAPDGRKLGAVVSMHDITERKKFEQAQREAAEAAANANKAKSVFLANMSHELRTPLNAVLGFTGILSRDSGLTPDQKETVKIIKRSGEHLLALIDEVLDMAKIEAGHVALAPEPVNLIALVDDLVAMMRYRAESRGLSLVLDRSPEVPRWVCTDPGKVRQVLINFLGNAIKYTESGHVILRLSVRPGNQPNQVALACEVEDTGIGIAPEDLERIFMPFEQVGGYTGRVGTGLGLAITRHYLRLLGAAVDVKSTLGRGTLFRFVIPVTLERPDAAAPQPSLRHPSGLLADQPAYQVLVVDDEEETRLLLRKLLVPLGFSVHEAMDGAQALDMIRQWRPDLIFMDRRMPGINGAEVTRRLRASPDGAGMVIIGLSASVFDDQRQDLMAAGCDGFVRKPFREEDIFRAIEDHLGARFRYDEPPGTADIDHAASLERETVLRLPPSLLKDMREHIVSGDIFGLMACIDGIGPEFPELRRGLKELAQAYDYDGLMRLLKSGEPVDNG